MDDFLWRALLGGLGVALVAGPVGCVVVWRRMAYFGAALAHSALLGVALGLLLDVSPTLGIFSICVLFALALFQLEKQHWLADDTLLGILAHSALALGLVVLAFLENLRVDLFSYLFGDILAVSMADLYLIGAVLLLTAIFFGWLWRDLLALCIHAELAAAEGVPTERVRFLYVLLLALIIAIGMKVIGMLLIVSLLVIPPASARRFARTPEQMAALSALFAAISVLAGLSLSVRWDIATGPAIVLCATAIFVAQLLAPQRKQG